MPRGNGTGPMGMGPMTGRAAGFCAGRGQPGFMDGGGCGLARGMGGGFRNRFFATGLPGWMRNGSAQPGYFVGAETKQILTQQAEELQGELDRVHQQLDAMEAK